MASLFCGEYIGMAGTSARVGIIFRLFVLDILVKTLQRRKE